MHKLFKKPFYELIASKINGNSFQEIVDFLNRTGKVAWAESNRVSRWSFGIDPLQQELGQLKDVEAQIELKGNGKNYTVSSQMADAPKEGAQLQKKQ